MKYLILICFILFSLSESARRAVTDKKGKQKVHLPQEEVKQSKKPKTLKKKKTKPPVMQEEEEVDDIDSSVDSHDISEKPFTAILTEQKEAMHTGFEEALSETVSSISHRKTSLDQSTKYMDQTLFQSQTKTEQNSSIFRAAKKELESTKSKLFESSKKTHSEGATQSENFLTARLYENQIFSSYRYFFGRKLSEYHVSGLKIHSIFNALRHTEEAQDSRSLLKNALTNLPFFVYNVLSNYYNDISQIFPLDIKDEIIRSSFINASVFSSQSEHKWRQEKKKFIHKTCKSTNVEEEHQTSDEETIYGEKLQLATAEYTAFFIKFVVEEIMSPDNLSAWFSTEFNENHFLDKSSPFTEYFEEMIGDPIHQFLNLFCSVETQYLNEISISRQNTTQMFNVTKDFQLSPNTTNVFRKILAETPGLNDHCYMLSEWVESMRIKLNIYHDEWMKTSTVQKFNPPEDQYPVFLIDFEYYKYDVAYWLDSASIVLKNYNRNNETVSHVPIFELLEKEKKSRKLRHIFHKSKGITTVHQPTIFSRLKDIGLDSKILEFISPSFAVSTVNTVRDLYNFDKTKYYGGQSVTNEDYLKRLKSGDFNIDLCHFVSIFLNADIHLRIMTILNISNHPRHDTVFKAMSNFYETVSLMKFRGKDFEEVDNFRLLKSCQDNYEDVRLFIKLYAPWYYRGHSTPEHVNQIHSEKVLNLPKLSKIPYAVLYDLINLEKFARVRHDQTGAVPTAHSVEFANAFSRLNMCMLFTFRSTYFRPHLYFSTSNKKLDDKHLRLKRILFNKYYISDLSRFETNISNSSDLFKELNVISMSGKKDVDMINSEEDQFNAIFRLVEYMNTKKDDLKDFLHKNTMEEGYKDYRIDSNPLSLYLFQPIKNLGQVGLSYFGESFPIKGSHADFFYAQVMTEVFSKYILNFGSAIRHIDRTLEWSSLTPYYCRIIDTRSKTDIENEIRESRTRVAGRGQFHSEAELPLTADMYRLSPDEQFKQYNETAKHIDKITAADHSKNTYLDILGDVLAHYVSDVCLQFGEYFNDLIASTRDIGITEKLGTLISSTQLIIINESYLGHKLKDSDIQDLIILHFSLQHTLRNYSYVLGTTLYSGEYSSMVTEDNRQNMSQLNQSMRTGRQTLAQTSQKKAPERDNNLGFNAAISKIVQTGEKQYKNVRNAMSREQTDPLTQLNKMAKKQVTTKQVQSIYRPTNQSNRLSFREEDSSSFLRDISGGSQREGGQQFGGSIIRPRRNHLSFSGSNLSIASLVKHIPTTGKLLQRSKFSFPSGSKSGSLEEGQKKSSEQSVEDRRLVRVPNIREGIQQETFEQMRVKLNKKKFIWVDKVLAPVVDMFHIGAYCGHARKKYKQVQHLNPFRLTETDMIDPSLWADICLYNIDICIDYFLEYAVRDLFLNAIGDVVKQSDYAEITNSLKEIAHLATQRLIYVYKLNVSRKNQRNLYEEEGDDTDSPLEESDEDFKAFSYWMKSSGIWQFISMFGTDENIREIILHNVPLHLIFPNNDSALLQNELLDVIVDWVKIQTPATHQKFDYGMIQKKVSRFALRWREEEEDLDLSQMTTHSWMNARYIEAQYGSLLAHYIFKDEVPKPPPIPFAYIPFYDLKYMRELRIEVLKILRKFQELYILNEEADELNLELSNSLENVMMIFNSYLQPNTFKHLFLYMEPDSEELAKEFVSSELGRYFHDQITLFHENKNDTIFHHVMKCLSIRRNTLLKQVKDTSLKEKILNFFQKNPQVLKMIEILYLQMTSVERLISQLQLFFAREI